MLLPIYVAKKLIHIYRDCETEYPVQNNPRYEVKNNTVPNFKLILLLAFCHGTPCDAYT